MADLLERASAVLTTTSPVDVFSVPSSSGAERVLVVGLNACNVSANAATLIVSVVTSGGATISRYVHQEVISANGRKELIEGNGKLVLKAGERLRAAASVGNALEITASYVLSS